MRSTPMLYHALHHRRPPGMSLPFTNGPSVPFQLREALHGSATRCDQDKHTMEKPLRSPSLFVAMLMACLVAYGQTDIYHPFPDSNAVWVGHYWPGLVFCTERFAYTIAGDTVIGNVPYHALSIPAVNSSGECTVHHTAGYSGCYRQDVSARKV